MASLQKSPEELQKEFDNLKRQIARYVKREGYKGTIHGWMRKLENYNELSVGSAIAELTYEGKMKILDKKQIQDGSETGTGLIIMGIYGPPKNRNT